MKLKNYYLIVISSLLLFSCKNTDEIKNDLEEQNLNGWVKSIKQNTYYAVSKFGEIVKGGKYFDEFLGESATSFSFENSYTEYNKNGYLIKSFAFFKETFIYDKKNKLIEKRYYSDDFKKFSLEKFKYDSNGLLIESNNFTYINLDSLSSKTKYKYDDEGNNVELNQYNSNGDLTNKAKNKYENKNLIEMKSYDDDGSESSHFKYVYDKNNNQIKVNLIDESGKTYEKIESKFNDKNQIIAEKDIQEAIINVCESKTTIKEYKYTKYDSNKNWIEKIEFKNSKPLYIIERKIEYNK